MTFLTTYYNYYLNKLINKFIISLIIKNNSILFFIKFYNLHNILTFLKYNSIILITSCMDITVTDYPDRLQRFEITYFFWSNIYKHKYFIKTFANNVTPIFSISNFFSSAMWLEREVWDMFGIKFFFHKDMRRILSDYVSMVIL